VSESDGLAERQRSSHRRYEKRRAYDYKQEQKPKEAHIHYLQSFQYRCIHPTMFLLLSRLKKA